MSEYIEFQGGPEADAKYGPKRETDEILGGGKWERVNSHPCFTSACFYRRKIDPPTPEPAWKIEYDNDTGPDDDSFTQWWTVTDGERVFRCNDESDAEWLFKRLAAPQRP